MPAPPVSFYPFTVKNTSGSRTQTGHTGHTRAHGGSHSQSVTDGDEGLTLHTQPSTQPSRSRPTKNAHTHSTARRARPQTVPRSHCPEPTRPQRTRTSARERARRDAPEPTVETEPAEPATEPPRPTLFRKRARSREPPRRPPPGPHLPPANPRPSKDHPSKCAAVQAVYFGPYTAFVQRTTSNIVHNVVVELENLSRARGRTAHGVRPAWCF